MTSTEHRRTEPTMPDPTGCTVFELRRYTLHPGRRDELIELFEREFVETQEEVGMRILGTFRDLDDPDRFVWLRGFADLSSRVAGLTAFYSGPVWRANRDAANATMADSDDVLLLRHTPGGRPVPRRPAPPEGGEPGSDSVVVGAVYPLRPEGDVAYLDGELHPLLERVLGVPVYTFRTEPAENGYPALPVREGENVYVWLAAFADAEQHARSLDRLAADPTWRDTVRPRLDALVVAPAQELRLRPTARSAFR